jgi:hypothetical protein
MVLCNFSAGEGIFRLKSVTAMPREAFNLIFQLNYFLNKSTFFPFLVSIQIQGNLRFGTDNNFELAFLCLSLTRSSWNMRHGRSFSLYWHSASGVKFQHHHQHTPLHSLDAANILIRDFDVNRKTLFAFVRSAASANCALSRNIIPIWSIKIARVCLCSVYTAASLSSETHTGAADAHTQLIHLIIIIARLCRIWVQIVRARHTT